MKVIKREYQKKILNGSLCHIWKDSGFSRPNVGRYAVLVIKLLFYYEQCQVNKPV